MARDMSLLLERAFDKFKGTAMTEAGMIINTIPDWINDPSPKERAFWLYGPAGAGKSAIAHSIAVLLQDISEDSRYAASFFFARDEIGGGDGSKLFSTLAYQFALKFPSFRSQIDDAMLDNPTLPTRSKRVQSKILLLLSKAIIEHNIPLRRPEYWIADSFDIGPFTGIARSICLRDDEDTDKNIAKVLHEGFKRIYNDNIRIMASVPRTWPSERVIKRFVRESSGQYVLVPIFSIRDYVI
ncbi:hypothetical protein CVT25_001707 [Psilocybe cyanescens]|uniref:Nephrocystin 3-like N-terminal domain-containing protein n=1 Tax=Psilocybe cyanescens TaxID=93625 RepID=A0A409WPG7_PSICY|nr:hypothetical protein CVT25_001707 [Psilocybe cyanescens]